MPRREKTKRKPWGMGTSMASLFAKGAFRRYEIEDGKADVEELTETPFDEPMEDDEDMAPIHCIDNFMIKDTVQCNRLGPSTTEIKVNFTMDFLLPSQSDVDNTVNTMRCKQGQMLPTRNEMNVLLPSRGEMRAVMAALQCRQEDQNKQIRFAAWPSYVPMDMSFADSLYGDSPESYRSLFSSDSDDSYVEEDEMRSLCEEVDSLCDEVDSVCEEVDSICEDEMDSLCDHTDRMPSLVSTYDHTDRVPTLVSTASEDDVSPAPSFHSHIFVKAQPSNIDGVGESFELVTHERVPDDAMPVQSPVNLESQSTGVQRRHWPSNSVDAQEVPSSQSTCSALTVDESVVSAIVRQPSITSVSKPSMDDRSGLNREAPLCDIPENFSCPSDEEGGFRCRKSMYYDEALSPSFDEEADLPSLKISKAMESPAMESPAMESPAMVSSAIPKSMESSALVLSKSQEFPELHYSNSDVSSQVNEAVLSITISENGYKGLPSVLLQAKGPLPASELARRVLLLMATYRIMQALPRGALLAQKEGESDCVEELVLAVPEM